MIDVVMPQLGEDVAEATGQVVSIDAAPGAVLSKGALLCRIDEARTG